MNSIQPRPSLDVRHKILMGACVGCLALGYLIGLHHASSKIKKEFLGTITRGLEKSQAQTEKRQKAFDETWKRQGRRRDDNPTQLRKRPQASRQDQGK